MALNEAFAMHLDVCKDHERRSVEGQSDSTQLVDSALGQGQGPFTVSQTSKARISRKVGSLYLNLTYFQLTCARSVGFELNSSQLALGTSLVCEISRSNMGETMPVCPETTGTPKLCSRSSQRRYGWSIYSMFKPNHDRSHARLLLLRYFAPELRGAVRFDYTSSLSTSDLRFISISQAKVLRSSASKLVPHSS
ncbi:hypothetical protein B0H15DRAFT_801483 [Mycena belliarum]|uniref:Uncharacterized protein n=1 Tax=Mycena belliarum TaxID=1033014 RepID=A0AAD6XR86_9AGAR|nr:hypothetical protein B0H15DRAFT_801483 [Mycena belliae]